MFFSLKNEISHLVGSQIPSSEIILNNTFQSLRPLLSVILLLFSHSVMSNSSVTPWTLACRDPLSMGFSRQEYWRGLLFPFPGYLLTQGPNLCLLHCRQILDGWVTKDLYLGFMGHKSRNLSSSGKPRQDPCIFRDLPCLLMTPTRRKVLVILISFACWIHTLKSVRCIKSSKIHLNETQCSEHLHSWFWLHSHINSCSHNQRKGEPDTFSYQALPVYTLEAACSYLRRKP